MANKILIALSNPISVDREDEFNDWYDRVHGKEVTRLAGIRNITRYRAKAQVVPPGGQLTYRYLALYEVDDGDVALAALADSAGKFSMSDSIDLEGACAMMFELIPAR